MSNTTHTPVCWGCDEEQTKPLKPWGDFLLCEGCFKDTEKAYQEDQERFFKDVFKNFDLYGGRNGR